MKNTLMFLLVSLLLAFSLTACGGGQTNGMDSGYSTGADADYSTGPQSGTTDPNYRAGSGMDSDYGSQTNRSTTGSGLTGSTRGAMDDMGQDVRNAMDDAGRAVRNTVNGIENAM